MPAVGSSSEPVDGLGVIPFIVSRGITRTKAKLSIQIPLLGWLCVPFDGFADILGHTLAGFIASGKFQLSLNVPLFGGFFIP